jgi:hypothetical protein
VLKAGHHRLLMAVELLKLESLLAFREMFASALIANPGKIDSEHHS